MATTTDDLSPELEQSVVNEAGASTSRPETQFGRCPATRSARPSGVGSVEPAMMRLKKYSIYALHIVRCWRAWCLWFLNSRRIYREGRDYSVLYR